MTREDKAPIRLAESHGPAGDCVRQVLAEQEPGPPLPRFVTLRERRARRSRRQQYAWLAVVASTALLVVWAGREEPRPASIRAEAAREARVPIARSAASAPLVETPVVETPVVDAPRANPSSSKKARSAVAAARTNQHARAALDAPSTEALSPPAAEPDVKGGAKACAQLAREGAAERALGCYEELAGGSGITAELALFEQARLEGKVLHRPERALRKLDLYRQRFPNGSLRAEATLAQIDWLINTGDSARALLVVEEALASGLLRERSAELSRVRARLRGELP